MSIQSTRTITRRHAIERINEINLLIRTLKFKALEDCVCEPDYDLESFVNSAEVEGDASEDWTDKMLEHTMDRPFYRHSLFENYTIEED